LAVKNSPTVSYSSNPLSKSSSTFFFHISDLKKEFGGGDEKTVKIVELKRMEQEERTMKEFV